MDQISFFSHRYDKFIDCCDVRESINGNLETLWRYPGNTLWKYPIEISRKMLKWENSSELSSAKKLWNPLQDAVKNTLVERSVLGIIRQRLLW
jgi:hypothetical protein